MTHSHRSLPILLLFLAVVLSVGLACKKAPPPAPLAPVAVTTKEATPATPVPTESEKVAIQFSYEVSDRNPFGSLLRVKKALEQAEDITKLTPLERIPVTDMTVQSIIISSKRSVAHVITPDGKAHIVSIGTKMGRHKGKLVRMNSDEIIVEEQFEDYLGKEFKQETVLRLREKEEENL